MSEMLFTEIMQNYLFIYMFVLLQTASIFGDSANRESVRLQKDELKAQHARTIDDLAVRHRREMDTELHIIKRRYMLHEIELERKQLEEVITCSGVFRGAWCDAPSPFWPDHENFLQATLYEKVRFLPFFSKFQKKNGRICGFYWTFKSTLAVASPPLPNAKYATDYLLRHNYDSIW